MQSLFLCTFLLLLQAAMGGGFHEHGLGFQLTTDDERGRGHGGGATAAPWWATAAPQGQGCAAAKFPAISSGEWKLIKLSIEISSSSQLLALHTCQMPWMDQSMEVLVAWNNLRHMAIH
jgi:hypothetical protein